MPFAKPVPKLARAADGTIYGGGHEQLGYFRGLADNQYEFVRLDDRLAAGDRPFGDVQLVADVGDDTVCFVATQKLFLYHSGRFTAIDHHGASAWTVDGLVYLHAPGGPLRRLAHGRVVDESSDPFFAQTKVSFLLRGREPGELVIGTPDRGLFRSVRGAVTPLPTGVDSRLTRDRLVAGALLSDGSFALGLANGNVLLVGADGRFLRALGEADGLAGTTVRDLGVDAEGGLWVAQVRQLTRVQWPSGFTLFDDRNGLPKAGVSSVLRDNGVLYAGTNRGVYRLNPAGPDENARFEPVPGGSTFAHLVSGPAGLLGATATQVVQLEPGGFVPVLAFPSPSTAAAFELLHSVRNPERVWIGQAEGLRSIRHTPGGWVDEGLVPGFNRNTVHLLEEADGTVWVANYADGYARVRFDPGDADARGASHVDPFFGGHGLPAKMAANNNLSLWAGAPLFSTDYGVYRFEAAGNRFVPFTEAGSALNQPPLVVADVIPGSDDHFWIRAYTTPPGPGEVRGRRFFFVRGQEPWRTLPHYANDAVGPGHGTFEEGPPGSRIAWIPGQTGLLRVELDRAFPSAKVWPVIVTTEASGAGEMWSDEMPIVDATDPRVVPNAVKSAPAQWIKSGDRVPFGRHDLRFHYTAPRLQLGAAPQYRTFLEGYDQDWSGLRADHSRTVTNLPEGSYVFHVRATDSDGLTTPASAFPFIVLPPWWRTWWAFAGYALAAAGVLAAAVRWRGRALKRRNEQLEATVATRTRELQASEAELRVARDAANTANRAKSAFLANMSHELRTPLNSISGYTQIMQRECAPDDRNSRRLEHVAQSSEHLLRLINDVLDLSKVEAGRIELAPRPCALRRLAGSLAEFFQARAAQAHLGFSFTSLSPVPEWVVVDEHRLRQVLTNLLGNALKYTEQGHIELRLEALNAARPAARAPEAAATALVRFEVRDTGIGVAPEDGTRIFAAFQQAAPPHLAAQGAGLGLAIAQRLVQLMGGQLKVESPWPPSGTNRPGRGSRFWFELELPLAPDPQPAGLTRVVTGYRGDRRRILIVDDEANNRALLRDSLGGLGFAIEEADGAAPALAACAHARPDAVLLDLRMPQVDGLALAPKLRQAVAGPLVIIALSASVYPIDRDQALAAGCDEFLGKPVNEAELFAALARLIGVDWIQGEGRQPARDATTPLEQLARPTPAALDELLALAECGDVLRLTEMLAELRRTDPQEPGRRCKMKTVLLVDDTPANLGVLIDVLRTAGYRLLVAEDGARALHQLQHAPADIILLDVMMPGIDGFTTCRRLKADPRWAEIPVIFMTARDEVVDKVEGFAAGAVDYVTKPLQPAEVVARVRTHLRLRELQLELQEKNAELEDRNERLDAAIRLRLASERALADSLDRAVVVASAAGEILFCTKRAAQLLAQHFPLSPGDRLPPDLRDGRAGAALRVRPLLVRGDSFQIFALEPVRADPKPSDLESLGLTPREAEVLFWIAEGKTNPEIAVILNTSINTVKRQSQAVFDKLQVENRTGAARLAIDRLERRA